jgi:DNA mismatch endonuclease, patch repair protein
VCLRGLSRLRFVGEQSDMKATSNRTPSFDGLSPASSASSHAKKMNRSFDTSHERVLRALLWKHGLRYRKNVRTLPGKPDIVFVADRVAVFCDGDFWHGRHWRRLARNLRAGTNAGYWVSKIKSNRMRDRKNRRLLQKAGWTVMRIWETDIHDAPEQAASVIESFLARRRQGRNAIH